MKLSQRIYCYAVIAVGIALGIVSIYNAFLYLSSSVDVANDIITLALLSVMQIICNCLPVYISENLTIDMTFMVIVAIAMTHGFYLAIFIIIISSPFYFERDLTTERVYHIFNMAPIKTLFNLANFIISTYCAGLLFNALGGEIGVLSLPHILLPYFAFVITMIFVNMFLLVTLFYLSNGEKGFIASLFSTLRMILLNMVAAAPIGFFFAMLLNIENGVYLLLLFLIPFLLARYAFKLYIRSKKQFEEMLRAFAKTIELKDPYTIGHSLRVEKYSAAIAQEMKLPLSRIERLKVAALLHDIGKIGVDDRILNKPSSLTTEEREQIQTHPQSGVNILENVTMDKEILNMIYQHHERYDDKGYPQRLKHEKVLMEAFIIAVADAYDALTSDRPYRDGMSCKAAVKVISQERGMQFHPEVVDAFMRVKDDITEVCEQAEESRKADRNKQE